MTYPWGRTFAASSSMKRSASSSGRTATPLIFTAFSCWKRLSERGTTDSRRVATGLKGSSLPFGRGLSDRDVQQRREGEHPALHRLHLQVLGEFQDLAGFGRRSHHEFDREIAAAGEGRRGDREDPDAGNLLQRLLDAGEGLGDGALAVIPWFG